MTTINNENKKTMTIATQLGTISLMTQSPSNDSLIENEPTMSPLRIETTETITNSLANVSIQK